jgi:hypothetical protein
MFKGFKGENEAASITVFLQRNGKHLKIINVCFWEGISNVSRIFAGVWREWQSFLKQSYEVTSWDDSRPEKSVWSVA